MDVEQIQKVGLIRSTAVGVLAIAAALLMLASTSWACSNSTGNFWLCPSATRCASFTRQSFRHGQTVYAFGASLVKNATYTLRWGTGPTPCHSGQPFVAAKGYTNPFTISGVNAGPVGVVLPASVGTYEQCGVETTGGVTGSSVHIGFSTT